MNLFRYSLLLLILNQILVHQVYCQEGDIEYYKNAPTIDATNAEQINSYENTPGSIVTYFYASKIRGDDQWEKVVIPKSKRSDVLQSKLEDYQQWKFHQFRLVNKQKITDKSCWVEIFMEIEFKGRKDSGNDEVTVENIKGKWKIVRVPT